MMQSKPLSDKCSLLYLKSSSCKIFLSLSLSFLQMSPELKYGRFQLAWLFPCLALNAVCFDLRRWLGNNMHTLCSSKQCALTFFFFLHFLSDFQSLLRLFFGSIQSKVLLLSTKTKKQYNRNKISFLTLSKTV